MTLTMLEGWTETKNKCPYCSFPLFAMETKAGNTLTWCARGECKSIGANEGAVGKNDAEAFVRLIEKLQLD